MNAARAPSRVTIAAIAIVAYAACDMVHEALGHGVATFLDPNVTAVSLSTVALSSDGSSRAVAAAGSIANLVVGLLALAFVRSGRGGASTRYFAWLFGSLNLLNATGYLMYSGILDFGDWAVVVAGLEPHAAWRIGLIVLGIASYIGAIRLSALALGRVAGGGPIDAGRLVVLPYLVGGALFIAGSALNPIPSLILLSGVSSGFGAMFGLLFAPRWTDKRADGAQALALPMSRLWATAGIVVAGVFVLVLGPGFRFSGP